MTDAVSSIPYDKIGSALDNVTPDLDDVADLASAVAKTGSRLGARTVRTSVRVVRRNPRIVAGSIAALIVVAALAIFMKKRAENTDAGTVD